MLRVRAAPLHLNDTCVLLIPTFPCTDYFGSRPRRNNGVGVYADGCETPLAAHQGNHETILGPVHLVRAVGPAELDKEAE